MLRTKVGQWTWKLSFLEEILSCLFKLDLYLWGKGKGKCSLRKILRNKSWYIMYPGDNRYQWIWLKSKNFRLQFKSKLFFYSPAPSLAPRCCLWLSCVRLFATPWTEGRQAPLSVGFSRQEYWVGCHCLLHPSSISRVCWHKSLGYDVKWWWKQKWEE